MYFKYFLIEFITNSQILCKLFIFYKLLFWTELVAVLSYPVRQERERQSEIDSDFYFISCAAFLSFELLRCWFRQFLLPRFALQFTPVQFSSLQFSSVRLRGGANVCLTQCQLQHNFTHSISLSCSSSHKPCTLQLYVVHQYEGQKAKFDSTEVFLSVQQHKLCLKVDFKKKKSKTSFCTPKITYPCRGFSFYVTFKSFIQKDTNFFEKIFKILQGVAWKHCKKFEVS